jgi:hypothetical protein
METKAHLLGIYRTAVNRVQFTYASLVLWAYPDTPDYFEAIYETFPEEVKPHAHVLDLVRNEVELKIAGEQLYDTSYRAALNDLLALTKEYCHATGQLERLKAQAWYPLWYLLRNCFAHDMKFNFNPTERKMLPVTWRGVTIDISMNRRQLTHGQCSRAKMLELLEAAQAFVERDVA